MLNLFLSRPAVCGAAVLSVALWVTTPAGAQGSPKQAPPAEQAKVSDKDLRAFAKAYVEYHKIRQAYEPQLAKVQDAKEKEKIQREGDSKVNKALEKQGLTPESYNRLFTAVNRNEQLRKKALKIISEERKRSQVS